MLSPSSPIENNLNLDSAAKQQTMLRDHGCLNPGGSDDAPLYYRLLVILSRYSATTQPMKGGNTQEF